MIALLKLFWPQIVAIAGAMALGFLAAWNIQGLRLDALDIEYAQYQQQVGMQAAEARKAALAQKESWLKEKEDALIAARQREMALQKDIATARAAARGLRDDLTAIRNRLPDAPAETQRVVLGTLGDILAECSERYSSVAGTADQCLGDLKTLSDSWPK